MSYTLNVRDEPLGAAPSDPWTLEFSSEEITVKELIEERVHQEVRDHNARAASTPVFRGLVQPAESETVLNGYRLKEPRMIEWRPQAELALAAFEANGFLVLIGDRQATSLEERFRVSTGTPVSFVKLTPLVGG